MAQVKAVFYLPIVDNDGRDLTAERDEVEDALFLRIDGWTKLGVVQGTYRMAEGTRAVDDHYAFAVLCDDTRLWIIEEVLQEFKAKTTQEAICLEVQYNVEARFI